MVTRWDPRTRAGAVAIRSNAAFDMKAVEAVAKNVASWAEYQKLAGDMDIVETSPITGTYDWRAYIQEETEIARRREARERPTKKAQPVAPAPPPSHLYG